MDGLNKVLILGNLGADPELRMAPGGQAVLKMRIATTETFFDKENSKKERTEWHRVTVFGRRAEGLAKFLRKGMRVLIEGRNSTSSYEKEGQKHYSTEIIALDVLLAHHPRGLEGEGTRTASADAPFAPPSALNGGYGRAPAAAADIPY
jgi:single-strand DNA-binding protein